VDAKVADSSWLHRSARKKVGLADKLDWRRGPLAMAAVGGGGIGSMAGASQASAARGTVLGLAGERVAIVSGVWYDSISS
jgi:hypothetical protein